MAMEVDEPNSDFGSDSAHPPSTKKGATARGKKTAGSTVAKKKSSAAGRKDAVSRASLDITYHTY